MVFDSRTRQLFVLGRFVYYACRSRAATFSNDFYAYDTTTHTWSLLFDDTASAGGPPFVA